MGGNDDSSNLVRLTIEEHAEAHRILFEEHQRYEDWLAWKALSGQLQNQEINYHKAAIGGKNSMPREKRVAIGKMYGFKKGNVPHNKGVAMTDSQKKKLREWERTEEIKERMRKPKSDTSKMGAYVRTEEVKKKLSLAAKNGAYKVTCIGCRKEVSIGPFAAFHKKH
jgi:hypothetical protein